MDCDSDTPMSVETKTISIKHNLNWSIDKRSLSIARLQPRGERRGVIEANVIKNSLEFKLELCVSGWKNSSDGFAAFYLTIPEQETFIARYKIKIGNSFDRMSTIRTDFHLGVGFPNFCHQSVLDDNIINDSLNLSVMIEIFKSQSKVDIKEFNNINNISLISKPNIILSKLMNKIYKNRLHCDLKLMSCNKNNKIIIPVHKCILSSSSPVFNALFSHNFVENQSNELHLDNWNPQIIKVMVKFLYTGQIDPFCPYEGDKEDDETDNGISSLNNSDINNNINNSTENSNINNDNPSVIDDNNSMIIDDKPGNNGNNGNNNNDDDNKSSKGLEFDDENKIESELLDDNCEEFKYNYNKKINVNTENNRLSEQDIIYELFQIAECYKIENLIIACCERMYKELNDDNVCELLIQMNKYSHVKQIKFIEDSIWQYLIKNIRRIKDLQGYQKLKKHPVLMSNLVDKLSQ